LSDPDRCDFLFTTGRWSQTDLRTQWSGLFEHLRAEAERRLHEEEVVLLPGLFQESPAKEAGVEDQQLEPISSASSSRESSQEEEVDRKVQGAVEKQQEKNNYGRWPHLPMSKHKKMVPEWSSSATNRRESHNARNKRRKSGRGDRRQRRRRRRRRRKKVKMMPST